MQIKNEVDFNKHLKDSPLEGLYLLWGEEEYLIRRWTDTLTKEFDKNGFNYSYFQGDDLDIQQVFDATQQLPLMAATKCVVVNDVNRKGLNASQLESLEDVFANLPPETVLVVTAPALDGRSATGKKIVSMAGKHGVAFNVTPRDTTGILRYLTSLAKKLGCTLSPSAGKELIKYSGNQLQTLTVQLEKVCGYVGSGEITTQHIQTMITPSIEERVFDLSKAILAGNSQRALEIIHNLTQAQESPVMIVATLIMSYTDLYRAKIAQKQGLPQQEVVSLYGYRGREFRVRNAYNTRADINTLRRSLDVLYNCDRDLKSLRIKDTLVLEKAVIQLIYLREV